MIRAAAALVMMAGLVGCHGMPGPTHHLGQRTPPPSARALHASADPAAGLGGWPAAHAHASASSSACCPMPPSSSKAGSLPSPSGYNGNGGSVLTAAAATAVGGGSPRAAGMSQASYAALLPGMHVADACTITPALRAWIECLVTSRVEEALQASLEGHFASVLMQTHHERAADMATSSAAWREADQARQRLEAQLQALSDAQARLLGVVEALSGDAERLQSAELRTRSDALMTVERVMGTVDELQRSVEQDSDSVHSKLRQVEDVLLGLQRSHAEETARHRTSCSELHRLQGEGSGRQRQTAEELAGACQTIGATRQEVVELMQVVQRLDQRLGTWRTEVVAEVTEDVRSRVLAREASSDSDRHRLDALHREATAASAARAELETRLDGLRLELSGAVSQRGELEARIREGQQGLERRVHELESRADVLRSEIESQYVARSTLENRLKEGHQALSRRMDAVQSAATKDVQRAQQDIEEVSTQAQFLEQRLDQRFEQKLEYRFGNLRAEVLREARSTEQLRDESVAALEELRRECIQQRAEIEGKCERLRVELTTQVATRDSFEFRLRETQEESRKASEAAGAALREEVASLERRTSLEVDARANGLRDELSATSRRLGAELRGELKATVKQEQTTIAALDEQLWLTDQRLGQRIDEIVQQSSHRERISAAQTMAELAVASRSDRAAAVAAISEMASARSSTSPPPRQWGSQEVGGTFASASFPSEPLAAEGEHPLSDCDQLERLRQARRRSSGSSLEAVGAAAEALAGSAGVPARAAPGASARLLRPASARRSGATVAYGAGDGTSGGEGGGFSTSFGSVGPSESTSELAGGERPRTLLSTAREAVNALSEIAHDGGNLFVLSDHSAADTGSVSSSRDHPRRATAGLAKAHEAAAVLSDLGGSHPNRERGGRV